MGLSAKPEAMLRALKTELPGMEWNAYPDLANLPRLAELML